MSYQVLARKWRPQNFKQMVGQEHVLQALIHALDSQRLHHAYLFTGTRGVGKTTIGRILAKCLSCHTGITSTPCGECGACQSIAEGRYVDLIEIDAASRTKVEDMRELLDNVQYAPSEGRFKIYLIDEVHMLSQSSFNALLKTLEEPPEHVKFLFATTDPQKLPVTILSRCLQFNLKNMSPERVVGHLQFILKEEQIPFEDPALWALARAADGSMRDALSLTDQAIAYGNHELTEQGVSAMLGTVDQKRVYRLLNAVISSDARQMLDEVAALAEFSPDYASVMQNLISILHRVAIAQAVPGASDNSMGDKAEVEGLAARLSAEDVQLYYQIALVNRADLSIHPEPRAGLEMALLRMIAFQLDRPVEGELPSLTPEPVRSESDAQTSSEAPPAEAESASAPEPLAPVDANTTDVAPMPALDQPPVEAYEEPASAAGSDEVVASFEEPLTDDSGKKKTELVEAAPEPIDTPEIPQSSVEARDDKGGDWAKKVLNVDVSGMTQNLLLNMALESSAETLTLFVESGHYRLLNDGHQSRIVKAMQAQFGDSFQVVFVDGLQLDHVTPMMWRERRREDMLKEAKQALNQDPNVLALIESFDAVLADDSIKALGSLYA